MLKDDDDDDILTELRPLPRPHTSVVKLSISDCDINISFSLNESI